MYSKAQAESRIPDLEKEVFELLQKLFEASKAREVLGNQIKKILQLEAEVANLKHTNIVQRSVHQEEVEALKAEIELLLQEHAT